MTFIKNIQGSRITGSITASFTGDGSGLTGIISASNADTASYVDLVAGTNITINQVGTTYTINSTGGGGGGDTFPYTGSAIISGSLEITGSVNISGSLVASGLSYPTADQENGDVLTTDGLGNLTFEKPTIYAKVKNATAGTLLKGMPLHASSSVGNVNEVIVASASNAATMPATFILAEQLTAGQEGLAITTGFINGVDTSGFDEGQVVYVGPNGGYTNVKPTGSNLIQNLGIVTKVDVNGSGFILGAGRSNDVPNITEGYAWIGNSNGVATPTATSSIQNVVSSSFAATASYVNPLNQTVTISGSVGIGTITPSDILEVTDGTTTFATNLDNGSGPLISVVTTNTDSLTRFGATDGTSSINIGTVGTTYSGIQSFGAPSDSYIYSNSSANGLNIISQPGTGTEDYIRLYAGGNRTDATASIHIQGDGSTTGYVGIGTETPSDRLSVSGSTGQFRARVDRTLPYTAEFYGKTTNSSGSTVMQLINDTGSSIVMGVLGSNRDASVAYGGESDDAFMFASSNANNLHIFNGAGTGTEDSINFYAGNNATATPHLHIHGSGSTKGYVGIGTETPTSKLEVVGSFNLREYGTISAPTSSAGWYRIGYTSGGDRGGIRVVISYTGGNWVPNTYVINAFKNYAAVSTLQLEKYGITNYITEARIVEDEIDSSTYHLEVYLASYAGDGVNGHIARIYFDKNLGYEGSWNLNTGALSASTSVANPVARTPFTSVSDGYTFENIILNNNINNNFWKLEDGDGTLNFKDWDSDNLIQLDGVNDQVNISHSLQVLGGITGSLLGTASFASNVLFEPGQLGTNSTVRTDSFNTASGNYSFAVGTDNNASGVVAITLGSGNTASGDRAVALGRENIASGSRSFASGFLNISSHNQTFAHGYLNTASQQYAVAFGRENTSAGIGSIALGYLNYLATGSYSFAAGYDNTIVPSYAGAIGYQNTILSTYGMAFGALNQAGNYAVAAGYNNDSTAIYSVALGGSNLASGNGSVALGTTNKSLGSRSIAAGYLVTASADYSVAIGREISANALYSSAVGGRLNNADAIYSGIFAGLNNNVPAAGYSGSVIIGGDSNVNSGSYSAIIGGRNNTIGPAGNSVIIGGTNINAADTSNTVFVPNFYATGSITAPNLTSSITPMVVFFDTSSGLLSYGTSSLDQVLAAGNTTSGTNIVVSSNDEIQIGAGASYGGLIGNNLTTGQSGIELGGDGTGITIGQYQDDIGDPNWGGVALNINNNSMTITEILVGNTPFAGVEYAIDYSTNYTNRSLVDKEYVDTATFPYTGSAIISGSLIVTGSIAAPSIANAETSQVVYYNTSSGAMTYGAKPGPQGNAQVDDFYYSISNSVDTRPIFEDDNVLFNWDETGNDLEFRMKVAPAGSGDMRSLAYIIGGSTQNTYITTTGVNYDVYTAGVSAGNRLEVFITAENDVTYPAYHVIVYNTGESVQNTIWIQRITRN